MGITQKDLVIGVFAFTAVVMSEFDYFYSLNKEKFEGYIHYWRIIGYHIGQMDGYVTYKAIETIKNIDLINIRAF